MKHFIFALVLIITSASLSARALPPGTALPEFHTDQPEDWINSPPLTRKSLQGKVVVLDVWTFDCWNCYRSFPWLNSLEEKFAGQPFTIIGIHSPEFEHEKDPQRVRQKAAQFKLHHPIVLDNDFSYWRALNNRYWPAFYLADKQGQLRYLHVGEIHSGDVKADAVEREIMNLLKE